MHDTDAGLGQLLHVIKVQFIAPNVSGLGQEAVDALRADIVAWVDEQMADVAGRLKRVLSRSGRTSLPGESPSRRSGDYADSWQTVTKSLKRAVEGRLGSKMWRKFGRHLEYGTERMKSRPHVGPVVQQWKRDLNRQIESPRRG